MVSMIGSFCWGASILQFFEATLDDPIGRIRGRFHGVGRPPTPRSQSPSAAFKWPNFRIHCFDALRLIRGNVITNHITTAPMTPRKAQPMTVKIAQLSVKVSSVKLRYIDVADSDTAKSEP
jgi:hypothetical protein